MSAIVCFKFSFIAETKNQQAVEGDFNCIQIQDGKIYADFAYINHSLE